MGSLLQSQGRFDEAQQFYREALEGQRRVLGDDHPNTLASISNLGTLLVAQGQLDEAEQLFGEALQTRRRTLGDDHPRTLRSIGMVGTLLRRQGRVDEAIPYYYEALEGRRRTLGDDHPSTLNSFTNMCSLLHAQGRLDEAEAYCNKAVEGHRRVLGDNHMGTLITVNTLGRLLLSQGKHQGALDLLTPIEPTAREVFTGGNAWRLADMLVNLALIRIGLGYDPQRFAIAEANLLEAHPIIVDAFGEADKGTLTCVQGLVDLYTAWHEAEPDAGHEGKAGTWRAKLASP